MINLCILKIFFNKIAQQSVPVALISSNVLSALALKTSHIQDLQTKLVAVHPLTTLMHTLFQQIVNLALH
jgi:hypothetical protein